MYNGAIQTLPLTFLTQLATTDLMPHGRQIEHYYYVHQAGQLYNSKLYRPKVQADGSFLRVWKLETGLKRTVGNFSPILVQFLNDHIPICNPTSKGESVWTQQKTGIKW